MSSKIADHLAQKFARSVRAKPVHHRRMVKFRISPNKDEIHNYPQSAAAGGELAGVKIPVGFDATAEAGRAAVLGWKGAAPIAWAAGHATKVPQALWTGCSLLPL